MSGKHSRNKGAREERAIVRYLQEHGFASERVPLSGAAGGRYSGDIVWPLLGVDRVGEIKIRARGFAQLYAWLKDADFLIVRADHHPPLLIMPLSAAMAVAKTAEQGRANE